MIAWLLSGQAELQQVYKTLQVAEEHKALAQQVDSSFYWGYANLTTI